MAQGYTQNTILNIFQKQYLEFKRDFSQIFKFKNPSRKAFGLKEKELEPNYQSLQKVFIIYNIKLKYFSLDNLML